MSAILPEDLPPLQDHSTRAQAPQSIGHLKTAIEEGWVTDDQLQDLFQSIPREHMRKLVYEYAGMDASLLMTLNRQVKLVDAVLNQIVHPDGRLRPLPDGIDISLKDALTLSTKVTQMILRDLPKVYSLEKNMAMERAMGNIMEKHFTPDQQREVLVELEQALGS